jgi:hypothetical protein
MLSVNVRAGLRLKYCKLIKPVRHDTVNEVSLNP